MSQPVLLVYHPLVPHPLAQFEQEEFAAVSYFARQLNFYGFRKIQTKPIRNEDFDKSTAKHVTFFNEKFKRGWYDLLNDIQQ